MTSTFISSLVLSLSALIIVPGGPSNELMDRPDDRELTDRGRTNLIAFAKVYGVVRFFHPSDSAQETDWDSFAIHAVSKIEGAEGTEDLSAVLEELFYELAPTAAFWSGKLKDSQPSAINQDVASTQRVGWVHVGLGNQLAIPGSQPSPNIYQSIRIYEPLDLGSQESQIPPIESSYRDEVGGGVCCDIPLTCLTDEEKRTLPVSESFENQDTDANSDRRSTQIASVISIWNAMQHFYPYFDVTDVDWESCLEEALSAAATAEDHEFTEVLEKFYAKICDGHGRVVPPARKPQYTVRAQLQNANGHWLVVVADSKSPIRPGDEVLSIDGKPIDICASEIGQQVCAAGSGWLQSRIAGELLLSKTNQSVELELMDPEGEARTVMIDRVPYNSPLPTLKKPANGEQVAPGIHYYDLNQADWQDLEPRLDVFAKAKGIVFDLRGYPGSAGSQILPHLSDETLHSAWWNIPHYLYPNQENVEFARSHWTLPPKEPRLPKRIAFITDGRAISYAESCMGIVEHYKLGEIIGEPTAGSNGNINQYRVPSGHVFIWTGMKVTKHDDSQHHGIGILPTVECVPTAKGLSEGKDELLLAAIRSLQ